MAVHMFINNAIYSQQPDPPAQQSKERFLAASIFMEKLQAALASPAYQAPDDSVAFYAGEIRDYCSQIIDLNSTP